MKLVIASLCLLILLFTSTYSEVLEIPLLGKINVSIFQNYTENPLNFTISLTPSSIIIYSSTNFSKFDFHSNSSKVTITSNSIIIPIFSLNSSIEISLQNYYYDILIIIKPNFYNFTKNQNTTYNTSSNFSKGNVSTPLFTPLNFVLLLSVISIVASLVIKILRRTR